MDDFRRLANMRLYVGGVSSFSVGTGFCIARGEWLGTALCFLGTVVFFSLVLRTYERGVG